MLRRALTSPKRTGARRETDLYYYYAAFAQSFVDQKILELNLPPGALILDPWCGSGTTLASARDLGHPTLGCDINPVSVVLSKSRFASASDAEAVIAIIQKTIRGLSRHKVADLRPEDLLWTLRDKLFRDLDNCAWRADGYRSMPSRAALLVACLFFFARQAVRNSRSKNPSWRMRHVLPRLTLKELCASLQHLEQALLVFTSSTTIRTGDFDVAVIDNESQSLADRPIADAVITSPPYLTRLDYGVSTGIEWRLLSGDRDAELTDWRASFTGSVLTSRMPTSTYPLPSSVGSVLQQIHAHPSKAAQTYYFYFFRNYFVGIQNALVNISAACKPGARGLFVVQDSQFKDLNIPLTRLFSDMLTERGWAVERSEAFSISPTFYKINTKRWAAESFVRSENLIWAKRVS